MTSEPQISNPAVLPAIALAADQQSATIHEVAETVRFGFRVPTSLLISAKHVALDQEVPLALLVRRWIGEGLVNGRDQRMVTVPTDGRLSEYPIVMPTALRKSIQELSDTLQLSAAKLVRQWIAQGVAAAVLSAHTPYSCAALPGANKSPDARQIPRST